MTDSRDSKIKQVRIETPPQLGLEPHSPSYVVPTIHRVAYGRHAGSPPPSPPGESGPEWVPGFSNWEIDAAELNQGKDVAENTRKNSVTGTVLPSSTMKIVNPFQKALATLEWTGNQSAESRTQSAPLDRMEKNTVRGQLDVDAFTRMLMAGTTSAGASSIAPSTTQGNYFAADSSSTDTSSSSRCSLSEAAVEVSPRTSYEKPPSSDGNNDKHRNSVNAEKTNPTPPMRRNGKPVPQRNPQTVSFDDFSPSDPGALTPRTTTTFSTLAPFLTTISDPNKRLPTPPAFPTFETIPPTPDRSLEYAQRGSDSQSGMPSSAQHTSPEPLLSRHISYSNSSTQILPALPGTGNLGARPAKVPPPPPPAQRKVGKNTDDQSFTADTGSIAATVQLQDINIPSVFTYPVPNNNAAQHPGSSRSSSVSVSTRNNMPPPPPPPRRRGSSKSSLDLQWSSLPLSGDSRRLSGEQGLRTSLDLERRRISQDGARQTSAGLLSQVTEDDDSARVMVPQKRDVMGDLEALQREVDALRAQYTGN